MAYLLNELTQKFPSVKCPCGGFLLVSPLHFDYTCDTCGFVITSLHILSNPKDFLYTIRTKYSQFKRAQSDPMNQLPAHYRK